MCGIFSCILKEGCEGQVDIGGIVRDGLLQLQHRGQESAGIVGSTGKGVDHFSIVKGNGLVTTVFNPENLSRLNGSVAAVGHARYSTLGSKDAINCVQPFVMYTQHGVIAVAHNGEMVNNKALRKQTLKNGYPLSTDTDSEMIALFLASAPLGDSTDPEWSKRIEHFMHQTALSYSMVLMIGNENCLYAVRDPYANRPLCIGELKNVKSEVIGWIVTSESCAFSCVGATMVREVKQGEILPINSSGIQEHLSRTVELPGARIAFCIFEYVYFAHPASRLQGIDPSGGKPGQQVYTVRYRCGERLAVEAPVDADIVSNVPETSTPAAKGYAKQLGLPYVEVLLKNSYVGRTFIRPNTKLRVSSINLKFTPLDENYAGKRVILIDDSIVRGNTMKQIVKLLKEHGAKEVHIRVASPPLMHPCYMGINIPTRKELQANAISDIKHYRDRHDGLADYNSPELAKELGADSVVYLSVEGLVTAVRGDVPRRGYCTACLTEEYPVPPPVDIEELVKKG